MQDLQWLLKKLTKPEINKFQHRLKESAHLITLKNATIEQQSSKISKNEKEIQKQNGMLDKLKKELEIAKQETNCIISPVYADQVLQY